MSKQKSVRVYLSDKDLALLGYLKGMAQFKDKGLPGILKECTAILALGLAQSQQDKETANPKTNKDIGPEVC